MKESSTNIFQNKFPNQKISFSRKYKHATYLLTTSLGWSSIRDLVPFNITTLPFPLDKFKSSDSVSSLFCQRPQMSWWGQNSKPGIFFISSTVFFLPEHTPACKKENIQAFRKSMFCLSTVGVRMIVFTRHPLRFSVERLCKWRWFSPAGLMGGLT